MRWPLLLMPLILSMAACSPGPPAGQVVARVDGIEVTRRDLLVELTALGAPADIDTDTVGPMLLDRIIARKLLVQEAEKRTIDRSPEFLGRMRRDSDLLLVDQLQQRLAERFVLPSPAVIARYVDTHHELFDRRRLFNVDRIVIPSGTSIAAAGPLLSMDAAAGWLARHCVAFQRTTATLDSLTLDPGRIARLDAAAGRPVVGEEGGNMVVDRVISVATRPIPPGDRHAVAITTMQRAFAREQIERQLSALKASARIEYQPGFGPSATRLRTPPSCPSEAGAE